MRLELTVSLEEPRTMPELREQLIQLRAAAEIMASQTIDREGERQNVDPIFQQIGAIESRAAEMPIVTLADLAAGLDVLREIIEPDGWQFADWRDARLFAAIRERVGELALTDVEHFSS